MFQFLSPLSLFFFGSIFSILCLLLLDLYLPPILLLLLLAAKEHSLKEWCRERLAQPQPPEAQTLRGARLPRCRCRGWGAAPRRVPAETYPLTHPRCGLGSPAQSKTGPSRGQGRRQGGCGNDGGAMVAPEEPIHFLHLYSPWCRIGFRGWVFKGHYHG